MRSKYWHLQVSDIRYQLLCKEAWTSVMASSWYHQILDCWDISIYEYLKTKIYYLLHQIHSAECSPIWAKKQTKQTKMNQANLKTWSESCTTSMPMKPPWEAPWPLHWETLQQSLLKLLRQLLNFQSMQQDAEITEQHGLRLRVSFPNTDITKLPSFAAPLTYKPQFEDSYLTMWFANTTWLSNVSSNIMSEIRP